MSLNSVTISKVVTPDYQWFRPGVVAEETGKLLTQGSGIEDSLEAVINGLQWMAYFGHEKAEGWSEELETINLGLSLPGLVGSLGDLRNSYRKYASDEAGNKDIAIDVVNDSLRVVNKGAKVTSFFESINVISLTRKAAEICKGVIWSTVFFMDGIALFNDLDKAQALKVKADKTVDLGKKEIVEHKMQIAYLNVLKAANSVALATIVLVSLLFSSLAQGFLFSPVVFLSLTTTWLILNFASHFYEKIVDSWKVQRLALLEGKV